MKHWIMEVQKYSIYLGVVSFIASLILLVTRFAFGETNIILEQNLFLYMMISLIISIISNGIHYGVKYSSSDKEAIIVIYMSIMALPIFMYLLYLFISI